MLIKLVIILLTSQAFSQHVWEVSVVDADKKIQRYTVKSKKASKIELKDSKWNCFLSEESEGNTGFGRSIDCKYDSGPAYISNKLFCPKRPFKTLKVNTFAVAEEKGAGYLLELICLPGQKR